MQKCFLEKHKEVKYSNFALNKCTVGQKNT